MDEDALLEWLGGKSYKRLKRHNRVKKIQDRADDDNGNDDKSSADYIPMESISREYVKVKNRKDKKELDRRIDASIDLNKYKAAAPAARNSDSDDNKSNKKEADKPTGKAAPKQLPEPETTQAVDKPLPKLSLKPKQVEKPNKVLPVDTTGESSAPVAEVAQGSTTTPVDVELPEQSVVAKALKPISEADKALITEQVAKDNEAAANPNERAATPRLPSLVNQLPPTELQPIADIPGGNGELKGVEADDPPGTKPLPLQLDIPAGVDEQQPKADPVLNDLSDEFRRATSKPISLFGNQIDPASQAYDAADRAIAPLQLFNEGLLKTPTGMARLANFINYPLDKFAGTDAFGKNNRMLDKADAWIDSLDVTRQPTNVAERAMTAVGMLAMPLPGASLSAPAVGVGVALNEGVHQVAEAVTKRLQRNPPVQNKYDELEPRVTSVDGKTAKEIQQKLDADARSFIPKFAEANYGDGIAYVAGAAAALYGLYRGHQYLKAPVAGRTILNPSTPIVEVAPESATTAKEALRTINQDANYVLESQARKFNDLDLVHDISTSTRAGMAARVESMIETGRVNTPGYEMQLSVSPKQLVEQHLKRPEQEQQDVSRAFHILDQVDHAKLNSERRAAVKAGEEGAVEPAAQYMKMPPQPDVDWATQLLAKPENAGFVRAMNEIRQAKAKVAEASGRWDAETTSNMLAKRPNYVHRVATEDYNIIDGEVVPKTRLQMMQDALKSKRGNVDHLDVSSAELSSALERERVNAPNQMVDAILANVDDLQKTSVFAHENDIVKRFHRGLKSNPEFEKSVITLEKGDKVPKGFETVSYYDGGKQVRFAVEPLVARALKFAPTSQASRYNIASSVRNAFQAATTGPVLAPFFAGTSFTMEASIGAATRARSMRVGNIDTALQAVTGGKLAAPGDMFGTMAAGVGAIRRAQRADNLLHNIQKTENYLLRYGNRSLQDLEAQMPGTVKKIARGLTVGQDATLENILQQNRQLYEQTAKGWALKNGALHSSQNELMRNANKFYSSDILHSFQRHLGHEEGSGWYNWYKNLILNIHDAGRLTQVERNLGRADPKELAYQTRKFSGDLGVRGMGNADSAYILSSDVSRAAQIATKALTSKGVGSILDAGYASIPYINPHIQGTTRFLEQLAKQPTTVIAGAMNSTTIPTIASVGLAATLGPQYLDYLLNKREEYKKTGYLYVPVPGRPPEDGLDFRIDPILAPFGYPVVEALDSVFGIRKYVAQMQKRETPAAETQGVMSALGDGIKEAIGFGLPIQASVALASQGISATRNIFDPSFAMRSEQTSKVGTGKNPGSALSVPTQMMLENIIGATAQHAIAGMDAYVSTGKGESALANAAKGAGFSFVSKAPVVGTMLAGKNFNESGSVLASNVRKFTDASKRITAAVQASENILLKSANAKMAGGNAVDPVKMGNPGIVYMPPELQQNLEEIKGAVVNNGRIKGINSERSAITTALGGLRGINAGNIGRHLLVPLKEGKEIGGLGYTILNEELLKKELAKEQDSIVHPRMTKGGKTRAPREAKDQRALALPHLTGGFPKIDNGKVKSPEDRFYKPPTLKEVQALKNALNERRYTLDLEAADEYEAIQQALGINLVDISKKIKLTPEAEGELEATP